MLFVFYVWRSLLARLRANIVTMLSITLFVIGSCLGLAVYLGLKRVLVDTTPRENILVLAKGAASEKSSRLDLEAARKAALVDGVARDDGAPLAVRELVSLV